jgi:hypothetical protein
MTANASLVSDCEQFGRPLGAPSIHGFIVDGWDTTNIRTRSHPLHGQRNRIPPAQTKRRNPLRLSA